MGRAGFHVKDIQIEETGILITLQTVGDHIRDLKISGGVGVEAEVTAENALEKGEEMTIRLTPEGELPDTCSVSLEYDGFLAGCMQCTRFLLDVETRTFTELETEPLVKDDLWV